MNKNLKIIGTIILLLIALYLIWYFSNILVYVLIAGVLSFIGQPLVRIYNRIRIGKLKIPHTLSAIMALVSILAVMVSIFLIFVPVITRQAAIISSIDFQYLGEKLEQPLNQLEETLKTYRFLDSTESLETIISQEMESVIDLTMAGSIFQEVLGFAGSLFIGLFSVIFLTFFFLRDEHMFYNGILLFVPRKYEEQASAILSDTRRLLSRYFVGLSFEVISMIFLITTGLTIFGVESALLIGFLGGLMNIIPYLGPIIGASIGVVIGATSNISMGYYDDILPISAIIIGTFAIANLIDNMVLQPLIYSASVKSHPIEIFLVILMAGSLAGIPGMILAIPGYTVLRIIAKQFFAQYKLVERLTENI